MEDLNFDKLYIQVIEEDDTVKLNWIGTSLNLHPSKELDPYFDKIVGQLTDKKLIINFSKLKIMNSSTVPPILKLVKGLEDAKIQTTILYDPSLRWQTASFRPLSAITKSYKNIEVTTIS